MKMDIFKIFDPIPHPVIAARGDTIEYKNAAAEALFSGDEHNRVSAVIPADYLRFDQEHFVSGFVLNGEDTSLLVSTVEGLRVYTLLTNGPSEDAILADALSNLCTALSDTVSSLKLAAGKLLPRVTDGRDEKTSVYAGILYHDCYLLQRLCGNLGAVCGSQSFSGEASSYFDLADLCRQCAEAAAHLTAPRHLEITVSCSQERLAYYGVARYLERLLLNLLSNSIKAVADGGKITIELTRQEAYLDLVVSDNGCGIADRDLADVFFRYKRRQALPVPGEVGMGLSVARKIAALYGGRILLESQPGEGTRVTVRLPIRQARDTVVHVMPGDYQLSGMNPVLMELSDTLPYTCYTEQYMD